MNSATSAGAELTLVVAATLLAMLTGSTMAAGGPTDPLAGITIAPEVNIPKYHRPDWDDGWDDADGDCLRTRDELLLSQSRIPATMTANGCKVVAGEWSDPYTGRTFTRADQLQVDHLVPLKEAHLSGGFLWSQDQKRRFAEDVVGGELVLTSKGGNSAKGDKDPGKGWVPTDTKLMCAYLSRWIGIKRRWSLAMDQYEATTIRALLTRC
jgi:hypothetical protein